MPSSCLSWLDLELLSPPPSSPSTDPTNSQATIRLFSEEPTNVRVTLFRDHHAWCPYCQKVWLWLEEKKIPYLVRKVTMFCYGEKEAWFKRLVPSGMLPAVMLDDQLITESDHILEALEVAFSPLVYGMNHVKVLPLRQLERLLFRAWCQWLCRPSAYGHQETRSQRRF
jgi:glutathione S-transferase